MKCIYSISSLSIEGNFHYDIMVQRSEKYRYMGYKNNNKVDMRIPALDMQINQLKYEHPHLSLGQCEVIQTARFFYYHIIDYKKFMIHSSVVVVDGRAYLFCAPSGIGKSTHVEQWIKYFGDRAYIYNDDRSVIGMENGKIYVWGTPWSKYSSFNSNTKVQLQGICVLKQSMDNSIKLLDQQTAVSSIASQYPRPEGSNKHNKILKLLSSLLGNINVWELKCNVSIDAAIVAYRAMHDNKIIN